MMPVHMSVCACRDTQLMKAHLIFISRSQPRTFMTCPLQITLDFIQMCIKVVCASHVGGSEVVSGWQREFTACGAKHIPVFSCADYRSLQNNFVV